MMKVSFKKLCKDLPDPVRAHRSDAGIDLYSTMNVSLRPGERKLVGTGIALELPIGTVGFINPRSGLALQQGLSIVNTPGTIDAGYRGEIKVCLINHDLNNSINIEKGQRIAQLVVLKVELPQLVEVETLSETERNQAGYGSTGI